MQLTYEQATSFARGQNDSAAATEYAVDECRLLENGRPSFAGNAVERRNGSRRLHPAAINSGAPCWGASEYIATNGTRHLAAFFGTKFYTSADRGATWVDQTGAVLLTADWYSIVQMRVGASNLLLAANGDNEIHSWNGTTFAPLTGGAPAGAKFLAVKDNRLYAAGHDGITVAASKVEDPNQWDTTQGAFTVRAQTQDGDPEIRGLWTLGPLLLVFKRQSTNYIEGFGVQSIQVQAGPRGVSRAVGCVGFRSIAPAGEHAVMWMSERGFEKYTLGGQIELVSWPAAQRFVDSLAWSEIKDDGGMLAGMYYPRRNEYWCGVPLVGTQNTAIYVHRLTTRRSPAANYVFRRGDLAAGATAYVDAQGYLQIGAGTGAATVTLTAGYLELLDAGDLSGLFVEVDPAGYLSVIQYDGIGAVLFTADTLTDRNVPHEASLDGFVSEMERGDLDNVNSTGTGGTAVRMKLETRPFFFRDPLVRKRARFFRATIAGAAPSTIELQAEGDGVAGAVQSKAFPTADLEQPVTRRVRVNARGRTIAGRIETTDAVQVQALELGAEYLKRT